MTDDTYADARTAAKGRVKHYLGDDPSKPTDASGYTVPGPALGMVATGARPVSRQNYRAGGVVHGEKAKSHLGRKPRASGGMTATQYLNRDVKVANEARDGLKHVGGFARGGVPRDGRARAHKFMGGPMMGQASPYVSQMQGAGMGGASPMAQAPAQRAVMPGQSGVRLKDGGKVHGADCKCAKCGGGRVAKAKGGAINDGTRPQGGRMAKASGGRAKKGAMNVNIIIAPPKPQAAMPPPMPPQGPPKGIPAPPPAAMGPAAPMAGAPPPMGPPAGAPPQLMRKAGGRAYPLKDGSGGGKGRLEKARAYG